MPSSTSVWSSKMESLYTSYVLQPIMEDDRSDFEHKYGIPYKHIFTTVLERGRCDFSEPFESDELGSLTPDERCMLYCFQNMRGHFHSSRWMFKKHKKEIPAECWKTKPLLIDIGAGPATSCLAFADAIPDTPFDYISIDSAPGMQKLAKRLTSLAAKKQIIADESKMHHPRKTWANLKPNDFENTAIIFNFSFFFASQSLTTQCLRSLADCVIRFANHRRMRVFICHTNSKFQIANKNYFKFLKMLELTEDPLDEKIVTYRNRRDKPDSKKQKKFSYEFFEVPIE